METLSPDTRKSLESLGERLRAFRLTRNETQKRFAARLGVSVATYQKLESGLPSVSIGLWLQALELLDRLGDLDALLSEKASLFAKVEAEAKKSRRRVARRRPSHAQD